MELQDIVLQGTLVITYVWLLILVFRYEDFFWGLVCTVIFPVTYILAILNYKSYNVPLVMHFMTISGIYFLF